MVNYGAPVAWIILIIVSILKFNVENVTICIIAMCLTVTNLLGYIKCEKNHNIKLKGFLYNEAKNRLSVGQMAKLGAMAFTKSVEKI
jgi:hypothetical protein